MSREVTLTPIHRGTLFTALTHLRQETFSCSLSFFLHDPWSHLLRILVHLLIIEHWAIDVQQHKFGVHSKYWWVAYWPAVVLPIFYIFSHSWCPDFFMSICLVIITQICTWTFFHCLLSGMYETWVLLCIKLPAYGRPQRINPWLHRGNPVPPTSPVFNLPTSLVLTPPISKH